MKTVPEVAHKQRQSQDFVEPCGKWYQELDILVVFFGKEWLNRGILQAGCVPAALKQCI